MARHHNINGNIVPFTAQEEAEWDAKEAAYAAKKAKEQNCEVWINAAPARKINRELLELTDIIIMNKVEAEFYKKTIFINLIPKLHRLPTTNRKPLDV